MTSARDYRRVQEHPIIGKADMGSELVSPRPSHNLEQGCFAGRMQELTSTSLAVATRQAATLYARGAWVDAERIARAIVERQPDRADMFGMLGAIALQTQRPAEAVHLLERAISLDPDDFGAYLNLASALKACGRLEEALLRIERALALKPDLPEAHNNRGNLLRTLRRFEEALACYEQALMIRPNFVEAHHNRALTLISLQQHSDALASCEMALRLKPEFAEAYLARGNALRGLAQQQAAISDYRRAIELDPRLAEAHCSLAITLQDLQQADAALDSYAQALRLAPELPWLRGAWLHACMQQCEWSGLDAWLEDLIRLLQQGRPVVAPFELIGLIDAPGLQRRATELWVAENLPVSRTFAPTPRRARPSRLRVGYFSADFHAHATAYLTAELFERHDPSRFDCIAFSYGPDAHDDMRQRLQQAFGQFLDVRTLSDARVAQLARELEIDIAVDLKGYTQHARPGVFAHRVAPLQVSYLGYPGTSGAACFDYLIADRMLIPEHLRHHYSEQIVYLPGSYQVNDGKRPLAQHAPPRAELALPENGFVFCAFHNTFKLNPRVFDIWMRLLRNVDNSVLWLLQGSPRAQSNLRREAALRGVDGERLVFAPRRPLSEHLSRHRAADLFLDTSPYNAHTSASDALWMALPVITRRGEAFAARVAASLLEAAGVSELITDSPTEYENLALGLAHDPIRLQTLRARLERQRVTVPLFDATRFARNLEEAFEQIYARYLQGQPPTDLSLQV